MRSRGMSRPKRRQSFSEDDFENKRSRPLLHGSASVNGRRWITVNPASGVTVSVLTYNILADSLVKLHPYLYDTIAPNLMIWPRRSVRIIDEIKSHNADFICLQEVDENAFEDLLYPALKSTHEGKYKKRLGDRKDGCAMFWKRDKVECVDIEYVEYSGKDNVGIVGLFRVDEKSLCLATTHLLWNPRRGHYKLAQFYEISYRMDKLIKSRSLSGVPAILCGDMNFNPRSPLYQLILAGRGDPFLFPTEHMSGQTPGGPALYLIDRWMRDRLKWNRPCSIPSVCGRGAAIPQVLIDAKGMLELPFKFIDSTPLRSDDGREYFSTRHAQAGHTVDFVFTNNSRIESAGFLEPLISGVDTALMPSSNHPSDHIPMLNHFNLL